jgi:hypothetical protein
MHDLDVCLDWQNITHKGKAPEVVLGLGNGSGGSPMRAKVGVQQSNHQLIGPVGGRGSDNHNLLTRGTMGGGPFATIPPKKTKEYYLPTFDQEQGSTCSNMIVLAHYFGIMLCLMKEVFECIMFTMLSDHFTTV